jgi:hypothetical protein
MTKYQTKVGIDFINTSNEESSDCLGRNATMIGMMNHPKHSRRNFLNLVAN